MHTAPAVSNTLGTYTKSIRRGRERRNENGPEAAARKVQAMSGRYTLMRTAQGLLWTKGAQWRDQHRTCWCSRSLKRESGSVSVYRNADGSGASMTGVNRCGEIWTCPVCAAKISETRRKDLNAALVSHVGNGGAAYLLTLTFPHEADHRLSELLEKFTKARQKLQNSKAWKIAWKDAGRLGSIASLELTASLENGWHPHLHMLVFASPNGLNEGAAINDAGDLASDVIRQLQHQWVNTLIKCGLGDQSKINDMMAHALNVRGGNQAAEYIAKYGRDERWGQSSEMTRHYVKQGAAGERGGLMHFTPFQLLTWAGQGDGWSIAKFCEYSEAIRGKRAITWSPGLKKALLGTDEERTDEEIANDEAMPEQQLVGDIEQGQYQTILRANMLPDFLRYVAESAYEQADLDDYIASIGTLPASHSGAVVQRGIFAGRQMVQ